MFDARVYVVPMARRILESGRQSRRGWDIRTHEAEIWSSTSVSPSDSHPKRLMAIAPLGERATARTQATHLLGVLPTDLVDAEIPQMK
jgi:hypothetical protein